MPMSPSCLRPSSKPLPFGTYLRQHGGAKIVNQRALLALLVAGSSLMQSGPHIRCQLHVLSPRFEERIPCLLLTDQHDTFD